MHAAKVDRKAWSFTGRRVPVIPEVTETRGHQRSMDSKYCDMSRELNQRSP
jgi:hypothetical protein